MESAYRRGLAENPIREKFGMMLIHPSWSCTTRFLGEDCWIVDPTKGTSSTFKIVEHGPDGSMLSETDRHFSGRLFDDFGDQTQEWLELHCDYSSGQLSLTYFGEDQEIASWIEPSLNNNSVCLTVIERFKMKWKEGAAG